jgi:hypothetical protein
MCGERVPERLSPTGRRPRGRPRVFCSERCRRGDRRNRAAVDPEQRREQVAAFSAAVRAGIAARGLSLRELEKLLVESYGGPLASSVATLSAWQTGSSSPARTAAGRNRVLALERCLEVPAGALALLMPGGAAVPQPRPPARDGGLAGRHARLRHLVTALTGPQQILPVTLTKDFRVDAAGLPEASTVAMRVRAAHDGVDRYWFVQSVDPPLQAPVTAALGCRLGRQVTEPAGPEPGGERLVATELLFDRPLRTGEQHQFAFEVRYAATPGTPPAEPVFRHVQAQPCERLDLAVSFDRAARPAEVVQCRWRQRDLEETWRREKTREGCWQYRLVVTDPVPGGYGWRWGWGRPPDPVEGGGRRRRPRAA